jgi:hypothetical protein
MALNTGGTGTISIMFRRGSYNVSLSVSIMNGTPRAGDVKNLARIVDGNISRVTPRY